MLFSIYPIYENVLIIKFNKDIIKTKNLINENTKITNINNKNIIKSKKLDTATYLNLKITFDSFLDLYRDNFEFVYTPIEERTQNKNSKYYMYCEKVSLMETNKYFIINLDRFKPKKIHKDKFNIKDKVWFNYTKNKGKIRVEGTIISISNGKFNIQINNKTLVENVSINDIVKEYAVTQKIDTSIKNIPLENFNPYFNDNTKPALQYNLKGFIIHSGITLGSGHYIPYIKKNNIWYDCNDLSLSGIKILDINKVKDLVQNAVTLLYERLDINSLPNILRNGLNANNKNLNIILKKPIINFSKIKVPEDGSCFYHAVIRYLIETGQLDSVRDILVIDPKFNSLKPNNIDGKYWGVILRNTCIKKTRELISILKQLRTNLIKSNYKDSIIINEFMNILIDYGIPGFTLEQSSNIKKYFDDAIKNIETNYLGQFNNFKLNKPSELLNGYLIQFIAKILNKCIMVYNNGKWETYGIENFSKLTINECIFIGEFGNNYNVLLLK